MYFKKLTMEEQKFSVKKRLISFQYAFNGFKFLIKEEHNSRIHLFAALCVIILSIFLGISGNEWVAIIFAIGFVLVLEIVNSAIENICDFISPEKQNKIKKIKDLSAAAVLTGAVTALIIGIIIFLPKLIELC